MDPLTDGDELLTVRIAALIGHGLIIHKHRMHDDRRSGQNSFLRSCCFFLRGRLSIDDSLFPLFVTHELYKLHGLGRTDNDVPIRKLILDLALHDGDFSRNDQHTALDFIGNVELIHEFLNGRTRELACCPCGQHGHTGSVCDEKVSRHF